MVLLALLKRLLLQITRVQSIHDKSLIYRDIKPDNFLIGLPGTKNANTIYVRAPHFLHLDPMSMNYPIDDRFWHGETLSRPKDETTHSLSRAQVPQRYSSLHEYQYAPRTRAESSRRLGGLRACLHVGSFPF